MPRVDIELLNADELLTCKDMCHTWKKVDTAGASVDHQRIFTHVDNDRQVLDRRTASAVPLTLGRPNITYAEIVETVINMEFLDSVIRGTNEHGTNDPKYAFIPVNEHGRNEMRRGLLVGC